MLRLNGTLRPFFLLMYKSPVWTLFGSLFVGLVVYELSCIDVDDFSDQQEYMLYGVMFLLVGVILFATFCIAEACVNMGVSRDYYLTVGRCWNLSDLNRCHDAFFAETSDFRPSEAPERDLRQQYQLLQQRLQKLESGGADESESWVRDLSPNSDDKIEHAQQRLRLQLHYLGERIELMS